MVEKNKIQRFISYYKPHKKLFLLDLFCAFTISALDLMFPLVTNKFLEDYIPNRRLNIIIIFTIILVVLYMFRTVLYYIMAYWGHILGVNMEFDMRKDLFTHIQTMDSKYFDDNKTGQIMARLTGDLREVTELAHHGPEDLFISLVMLIGSFFLLIRINYQLTLALFLFVIILTIFAIQKRKAMMSAFRNTRKKHAEINSRLESTISGVRLYKSFANEEYEIDKFQKRNFEYAQSFRVAYKEMAIFASGTNFLTSILGVVALSIGGIIVYYSFPTTATISFLQPLTIPELVMFILFATAFIQPIRRLVQFTQMFQSGFAGFERFCEIMDIVPEIDNIKNPIKLENPKGEIEFKDVSFKYLDNSDWILNKFNLTIAKGKTIALVGPSGVGKTTITHLIPRFYDIIYNGKITIDGVDIKSLDIESLRKKIGFVQQDVIIFFGSIRENILYGKPDATEEEIRNAAKLANIHEFIEKLPNGYNTLVGERGVKLSGGQKQRLALARVFLTNPPILILDEATSSLDNATELAIQDSIEKLASGRTTIIVAHRLSTIRNADEIIVITDNKGIAERGNHKELLESGGIYSELYKAQFKGYIPDNYN